MIIRWISRCFIALSVLGVAVFAAPPAHATDWPQAGFNAAHTGFNPDEVVIGPSNVGNLQLLWTNHVPCTIRDGVSVADGVVYYGHYCGEFRAVDAETGSPIWKRSLDGKDVGHAVVDGVAYVASVGAVYAFDAGTGTLLWTWDPDPILVDPPVISSGLVYVPADDGRLYMLDADSGVEFGSVSPGGYAAVSDGIVYVSTDVLRAYSSATLDLLWTGLNATGFGKYPVVANDLVYVRSNDGYVYAFGAGGCGEEFCMPLWRAFTDVQTVRDDTQPPSVGEGKMFVGANGSFFAFPADGCADYECQPLWQTATACRFFWEQPSVANGVVYTACDNDDLYAFDASAGDILWKYHVADRGYPMRSQPVIVDGRLFHDVTFHFQLYAFHIPGPESLGVETKGLQPGVWGMCSNLTTGQSVWIFEPGATIMNCGAHGLEYAEDDEVVIIIRGSAE